MYPKVSRSVFSVPEGDDKPLKYPLMFCVCDIVLITKTDTHPYFNFDPELAEKRIHSLNPKAMILQVCAKTEEGIQAVEDLLLEEIHALKRPQHIYGSPRM